MFEALAGRALMGHDDIRHKLSDYIDGSVTAVEKAEIEEHLKSCSKCSDALRELLKTVEHIKEIEETDPPAWLTQKIMTKVRAEAEPRRSIRQRLFHPLNVKLPIEAVAVLFLAVTAYYITQGMRPDIKPSPAPEYEIASPLARNDQDAAPAAQPEPAADPERKADRFYASPAAPAPAEERALKEPELFAPAPAKKREAAPPAGFTAMDESRSRAVATRAKAAALVEKKEEGITITIAVKDMDSAGREIEKAVIQLGGKIIKTDTIGNKRVYVARLSAVKSVELYNRLMRIGELRSKETKPFHAEGEIEIRIESVMAE